MTTENKTEDQSLPGIVNAAVQILESVADGKGDDPTVVDDARKWVELIKNYVMNSGAEPQQSVCQAVALTDPEDDLIYSFKRDREGSLSIISATSTMGKIDVKDD